MRALGAAALLFCCACGERIIDVTVEGQSEAVRSLLVQTTTPAGVRLAEHAVPEASPRFRLSLQGLETGAFGLQLSARDSRDCQLQAAAAPVTIDGPGTYPVTLKLSDAPGCRLVLQPLTDLTTGQGQVTVNGRPELSCAADKTCVFDLPKGAQVTLSAEAAVGSYFPGWLDPQHGALLTVGAGPLTVPYVFLNRQRCYPSGFCWENPVNGGTDLYAAWGLSADDIWAVGPGGTLLHRLGDTLLPVQLLDAPLFAVWGSAANDVWVAGIGVILHGVGPKGAPNLAFTSVPLPASVDLQQLGVAAIAGRGPDDVYFVGAQGLILRWDGAALKTINSGVDIALRGVVVDAQAVWVVGDKGTVLRGDRSGFRSVPSGTAMDLYSVWSGGGDEVYVGSGAAQPRRGEVRRYRAGTFVGMQSFDGVVLSILGGDEERWLAAGSSIYRLQGDRFVESNQRPSVDVALTLAGPGRSPLAVGSGGLVLRWTGAYWASDRVVERRHLQALWASSPADLWIGGDQGALLRWDGKQILPWPRLTEVIRGFFAAPQGILITFGGFANLFIDPAAGVAKENSDPAMDVYGIYADSRWLWRAGVDFFGAAVTQEDEIKRTTLLALTNTATQGYFLTAVYGSEGDLWATGFTYRLPTYDEIHGLAVHLVQGQAPMIYGSADLPYPVNAVSGDGRGKVWLVGDNGLIKVWNGSMLSPEANDGVVAGRIRTISVDAQGGRWIGGDFGIARWDDVNWSVSTQIPIASANIHRLSQVGDEVWAVGDFGAILRKKGARR